MVFPGGGSCQRLYSNVYDAEGTVKYLHCTGSYSTLYETRIAQNYILTPKWVHVFLERSESSADGGNIHVLILILRCSYVRCQCCRRQGGGGGRGHGTSLYISVHFPVNL